MASMKRIVIVGAGGHGRVLADLISMEGAFSAAGFVEISARARIPSLEHLGTDAALPKILSGGVRHAAIGVGASPDLRPRRRLQKTLETLGFALPALIHPSAVVSSSAEIAEGAQVMARAVVQACARLRPHAVVNTAAVIEHDCLVGTGAFVASGAVLGGGVTIGDWAFLGLGAVILPGVRIGAGALVAAGAVVAKDVPAKGSVMGVPARAR